MSDKEIPKPNIIAIIQARIKSTRLHGKVLLPLGNRSLLSHVIERSCAIKNVNKVVLATTVDRDNKPLIDIAESMDIEHFSGSEENVLERFYLVSEKYHADLIVRITADNPFMDPSFASKTVDIALETGADICSIPNLPLGIAVEIIKKEALNKSFKMSKKKYHFEHVTPYIKEHPENYKIIRKTVNYNNPFKDLRLTVDTDEDYKFAKQIYDSLYNEKIFFLDDVINYLTDNPELININSKIIQRPMNHTSYEN